MTEFSRLLIDRSGYLDEGFPDLYDRYRPAPPAEVLDVLWFVARTPRPRLVVDIGSGTGLATRTLAARADEVVGVEPNAFMVEQARVSTSESNVRYLEAFASETGLPADEADLVTAWQAFHWMEPQPALAEAARILRDGGVFAACDYDVVPVIEPEVEEAFMAVLAARREARDRLGIPAGASSWPKDQHVDQIRASGRFRHAREIVASGSWELDAERMIGLAESIGGPRELFGDEAPAVGETFERLRETAQRVLGERTWPALLSYRLRIGVK